MAASVMRMRIVKIGLVCASTTSVSALKLGRARPVVPTAPRLQSSMTPGSNHHFYPPTTSTDTVQSFIPKNPASLGNYKKFGRVAANYEALMESRNSIHLSDFGKLAPTLMRAGAVTETASSSGSDSSSTPSATPESRLIVPDDKEAEEVMSPSAPDKKGTVLISADDASEELVKPIRKAVYESGNNRGIKFSDSLHRRDNIYDQAGADFIENRRSIEELRKQKLVASAAISKAEIKMVDANKSIQRLAEGLENRLTNLFSDSIAVGDGFATLQNTISTLKLKILEAANAARDVVDKMQPASTTITLLTVASESLNGSLKEFSELTDMVALTEYFEVATADDNADIAQALAKDAQEFAYLIEGVQTAANTVEENRVKLSNLSQNVFDDVPVDAVAISSRIPRRRRLSLPGFQRLENMRQAFLARKIR